MSGMTGSMSSGMTSYKMGKESWKQAKREMFYKETQSAEEVLRMEMSLEEIKGTQKAKYGASGVTSEGTPMDVMLATEREGRREIEYKKLMDFYQLLEMRKAGRLAKKAGQYALWGGIAGAVGSLGSMGASAAGYTGDQGGSAYKSKSPQSGQRSGGSGGGFNYWSLLGE